MELLFLEILKIRLVFLGWIGFGVFFFFRESDNLGIFKGFF